MDDSPADVWAPGQNAALAPILPSEARALTRKIRKAGDHLWELLIEARDKQAWRAMGYASWDLWAEAEFAFTGRQAFREIGRGEVILALESALPALTRVSVSKTVQHRDVPVLKPDLPAVVEEVREAVSEGVEPAQAVVDAVARRTVSEPAPPPDVDLETGEVLAPPKEEPMNGAPLARTITPEQAIRATVMIGMERSKSLPDALLDALGEWLDNVRKARRQERPLTRREVTPNFKKAAK